MLDVPQQQQQQSLRSVEVKRSTSHFTHALVSGLRLSVRHDKKRNKKRNEKKQTWNSFIEDTERRSWAGESEQERKSRRSRAESDSVSE